MQTLKKFTAHIFASASSEDDPNLIFRMYEIEIPTGSFIKDLKKDGDSFTFEFNKGQGWIKAISQIDPISE